MRQLFATFAAVMPNKQAAQPAAGLTVVLCVLFSGFVIARENIPTYWLFIYWFSPLAWGLRAVLINEFRSASYAKSSTELLVALGCDAEDSDGVCFLSQFDFQHNRGWVTLSIAVLSGYFVFFALAGTVALDAASNGGSVVSRGAGTRCPYARPTRSPLGGSSCFFARCSPGNVQESDPRVLG